MSYLILGASSGLGRELAYILAKNSNDLIIISRDERDLKAIKSDLEIKFEQSNIEGELVTMIQNSKGIYDGIIINAAGYTHTSVAILDALLAIKLPTVEVPVSYTHLTLPTSDLV